MIKIYKIVDKENNKIYIGQTSQTLEKRNKERLYGKTLFDKVFREKGEENFDIEILETVKDLKESNIKEKYWIEYYDSTNPNKGYNVLKGGGNFFLTEETKTKIGEAQKGEKNHMFGKCFGQNGRSKRIMDLDTKQIFESGTQVKQIYNLKSEFSIYGSCKGKSNSYNNHRFRYVDENDNPILTRFDKEDKDKVDKRVICLTDNKIFNSYEECSKFYNIDIQKLYKSCEYTLTNLGKLILETRKEKVFLKYIHYDKYLNHIKENSIEDIKNKRYEKIRKVCNKKIKSITDNVVFESIKNAVDYYQKLNYRGISSSTIVTHLKKGTTFRYHKDLFFEYV